MMARDLFDAVFDELDRKRPLAGGFHPRAYQTAACNAVLGDFASGVARCVVNIPTGCGKTEVMFLIGEKFRERNENARTLIICPSIDLTHQTLDRARRRWPGATPDLEQSFNKAAGDSDVICASVQSLMSRDRYKKFVGKVDLVCVDECHWGFSPKQHAILTEFVSGGARVVGFSATPYVKGGILSYWDKISFDYKIRDATNDGYLVPCKVTQLRCESMDLSSFRVSGGSDFNGIELDKILKREQVALEFCAAIANYYKGMCSVGFCHSIAQAEQMREILTTRHGIKASLVHSKMSEEDRDASMKAFYAGDNAVILNVGVLIMGWDWHGVRNVFLFKPTASIARYIQMLGRGTRPEPGRIDNPVFGAAERKAAIAASAKPDFNVFDLTDNCRTHSLQTAVDLYAPEATPEVRQKVMKRIEKKTVTVEEIDAIVAEEMAEEAKRLAFLHQMEEIRRKALAARATFQELHRDPYATPDMVPKGGGRKAYMPFGKHKGKPVSAVPTDYLEWYRSTERAGWVMDAVCAELDRRVSDRRQRAEDIARRRRSG